MLPSSEKQIRTATREELRKQDMVVVDEALFESEIQKATKRLKLIYAASIALGIVFVVCGILVYRAPVAATLTGLVLYLTNIAVMGIVEPLSIFSGIILKIIFIVCLVKAVQAGVAYQREHRAGASDPLPV